MAIIFGVDLRSLVGSALAGQFPAVTVHAVSTTIAADGSTVKAAIDYPSQGILSDYEDRTKVARGYPMTTVKISIPQASLSIEPAKGHEITARGRRWRVLDVLTDTGEAMWELPCVPVSGGA